MKLFVRFVFAVLLGGMPGLAAIADEAALKTRAARFYQLQIEGKRAEAAQLVEPNSRSLFLNGKPVPYTSYKIDRVLVTGESAEVEVTMEMQLPLFPVPTSRSFPTPWKKIGGKWYFVVDTSAIQEVMSAGKAGLQEVKPAVLSFKPSVVFGLDGEIQKSLRVENKSAGIVQFRIIGLDADWLEIRNRSGEIPPSEYFPLVVVLKQVPRANQTLVFTVEGVESDKRIFLLEIPIELHVPTAAIRKEMERAIRKYRADQ